MNFDNGKVTGIVQVGDYRKITGCSFMFNVLNILWVSNRILNSWKF